MEFKEIQTLIKLVSDAGVDEVSIEKTDFKLTIKKNEKQVTYASAPVVHAHLAAAPQAPLTSTPASMEAVQVADPKSNLITIKAPMIGTFYRASSPGKPSFVNIGDEISPGKALCIIEAMKLFNEIESEISGKLVKVLVESGTPVEFDQPLFLVQPN